MCGRDRNARMSSLVCLIEGDRPHHAYAGRHAAGSKLPGAFAPEFSEGRRAGAGGADAGEPVCGPGEGGGGDGGQSAVEGAVGGAVVLAWRAAAYRDIRPEDDGAGGDPEFDGRGEDVPAGGELRGD